MHAGTLTVLSAAPTLSGTPVVFRRESKWASDLVDLVGWLDSSRFANARVAIPSTPVAFVETPTLFLR